MTRSSAEYMRAYRREWMRRRRADIIAQLGGKCAQCGSTARLQIDHIDPTTKVSHRITSWSKKRRDAELAKCQLLCWTHHNRKTLASNGKAPATERPHGTEARWRSGCRCAVCVSGARRAEADRKRRRMARLRGAAS